MLEQNGIIYEIFQEQDLEKAIACIVDVFPSSEPLAQAVGITQDEFSPFAEVICRKAVKDGLSHIAKDSTTGEVVGFIISENWVQENNEQTNLIFDNFIKLAPILSFLAQLEKQYMSIQPIEKKPILHWFMVGVKESYRNQKIAKILMEESLKEAKKRNFFKVICEATGIISQHNALKLGFKEIVAIAYQNYEYQGVKIFGHIENHQKCILMEKIL